MAGSKATKRLAKALSALLAEAGAGGITPERLAAVIHAVRRIADNLEGTLQKCLEKSIMNRRQNNGKEAV